MTNDEMKAYIEACAKSVRLEHKRYSPKDSKLIDINYGMPYIGINLPNGKEYFFQESAASEIMDEAKNAAEKFDVNIEDALIWMAQSW